MSTNARSTVQYSNPRKVPSLSKYSISLSNTLIGSAGFRVHCRVYDTMIMGIRAVKLSKLSTAGREGRSQNERELNLVTTV